MLPLAMKLRQPAYYRFCSNGAYWSSSGREPLYPDNGVSKPETFSSSRPGVLDQEPRNGQLCPPQEIDLFFVPACLDLRVGGWGGEAVTTIVIWQRPALMP